MGPPTLRHSKADVGGLNQKGHKMVSEEEIYKELIEDCKKYISQTKETQKYTRIEIDLLYWILTGNNKRIDDDGITNLAHIK